MSIKAFLEDLKANYNLMEELGQPNNLLESFINKLDIAEKSYLAAEIEGVKIDGILVDDLIKQITVLDVAPVQRAYVYSIFDDVIYGNINNWIFIYDPSKQNFWQTTTNSFFGTYLTNLRGFIITNQLEKRGYALTRLGELLYFNGSGSVSITNGGFGLVKLGNTIGVIKEDSLVIYSNEDNTLIKELKFASTSWSVPMRLLVVDTESSWIIKIGSNSLSGWIQVDKGFNEILEFKVINNTMAGQSLFTEATASCSTYPLKSGWVVNSSAFFVIVDDYFNPIGRIGGYNIEMFREFEVNYADFITPLNFVWEDENFYYFYGPRGVKLPRKLLAKEWDGVPFPKQPIDIISKIEFSWTYKNNMLYLRPNILDVGNLVTLPPIYAIINW